LVESFYYIIFVRNKYIKIMKTVKVVSEVPKLSITIDSHCESPRQDSNVGYFITLSTRYNSPDSNNDLRTLIQETSNIAKNCENHIELITEHLEASGEEVLLILPISTYEHSGIQYSIGNKYGFEYSNNGFYIVTKESLEEIGSFSDIDVLTSYIEGEIENYNKWVNNEIYRFELLDENGEFEDSRGGFYSLESIREQLPKSWVDECLSDYIK